MKKYFVFIFILIVGLITVSFLPNRSNGPNPTTNIAPGQTENENTDTEKKVTEVASNLYVPWSMAFLPNGDLFVTERNGNLKVIGKTSLSLKVSGVIEIEEGGLLGLALHPDFASNKFLYLYFTAKANGKTINKVVRYVFDKNILTENKIILDNIPGGKYHDGGRIAFGPDKMLYITTGDSGNGALAQNTNSLAGKILRVKDDGEIPADNPFKNKIYSYGHRNPQGLAWDREGNLWATEHGRSGVQSGFDEINFIVKGANYGWPLIQGNATREGMRVPVLHSGATTTWAPSGIAFKDGYLYFAGLRGETLYKVEVKSEGKLGDLEEYFEGEYGRFRGVIVGPDNTLYITTSNKDGRGNPRRGDDKILRFSNI